MPPSVKFNRRPIEQIAYFVPDIEEAARRHSSLFGSGPFYTLPKAWTAGLYRGVPVEFETAGAFGQWGSIMIEFFSQSAGDISVLSELHSGGGQGFHHVALIVDDLDVEIERLGQEGLPLAFSGESKRIPGFRYAFVDATAMLGHFLELYEPLPRLIQIFDHVRRGSLDFDGTDVVRPLQIRS
jgi:hypothetical protein